MMIYEVHRLHRCGSSTRWVLELTTAFRADAMRRVDELALYGHEVRIRPAKGRR